MIRFSGIHVQETETEQTETDRSFIVGKGHRKTHSTVGAAAWYNILLIRTLFHHLHNYYKVSYICSYSYVWGAIIRSYICCHSYVWGAIADSKGRKVVLITSGVLSGLSSGAFGFSTTYVMAIVTRFLLGLFNG